MSLSIFFDFIIFGFLIIDFAAILFFVTQFGRYKEKLLTPFTVALFCFLLIAGVTVFYGSFIESKKIVITKYELDLSKNSENKEEINIALISDFHLGPYKNAKFVKKIVKQLNAVPHDMILLAGDYVYGESPLKAFNLKYLKNSTAPLGKFAILGNHDYNKWGAKGIINENRISKIEYALKTGGFKILKNESAKITKNGKSFILGGVDELWVGKADSAKSFSSLSKIDAKFPKILLAHTPDIVLENPKVDAVFAGHTHGGQIRLPLIGPVPPLPTKLGRKYDQGLFDFKDIKLLITRGIGEIGPRARLFAPPEILLLKLKF